MLLRSNDPLASGDHESRAESRENDRTQILSSRAAWSDVGEKWLRSTEADSTERTYAWTLRRFFQWCERNGVDALKPGRDGIDRWRKSLLRRGDKRPTIRRKLSTLSSFYAYGVLEELLPDNPVKRVHRPKRRKESNRHPLSLDDALTVMARARAAGGRDAAVVLLLAWTGMRVAELRGLTVANLSTERGERVLVVDRKGGDEQTILLHRQAADALGTYLDGRTDGPLIYGVRGGPISRYEVAQTLDRYVLPLKLDIRITPHSMRHTFATLAFDAEADPLEVQRMMGHSSMATTMGYNHARGRVDRSPVHALAKLLG